MEREPILLQTKRFNFLPHRFLHRGVERRVRRIDRSWDVGLRWRQRPGRYFRVYCQDGTVCDLFHDVGLNTWYVARRSSVFERVLHYVVAGKGKPRWNFT